MHAIRPWWEIGRWTCRRTIATIAHAHVTVTILPVTSSSSVSSRSWATVVCCAPSERSRDSSQRTGDETTINAIGAHSSITRATHRSLGTVIFGSLLTAVEAANVAKAVTTTTISALT